MAPIAHSADHKKGIPEQGYREHVLNVVFGSLRRAKRMLNQGTGEKGRKLRPELLRILYLAAALHDLGKLSPGFQRFLKSGGKDKSGHIQHEDAGVVALIMSGHIEAALLVLCHHDGLVDLRFELSGEILASDYRVPQHELATRRDTDHHWQEYLKAHLNLAGGRLPTTEDHYSLNQPLTRRLLLSCLVDADHTDTAQNYRQHTEKAPPTGRWAERAKALDEYIQKIESRASSTKDDATIARNLNRAAFYRECTDFDSDGLLACDAPVGSGKTTAVLAHLLRIAARKNLRHIFIILPFTNIICQSVQVYRKSIVLPGENPEEVVGEHHHQVEFEDEGLRNLTTLWQSPIIVTTAVQFFETLAAAKTGRLRKLHELPGSCVFVDEAHAALPAKFLPLAWKWMSVLQSQWNCHFVLASGSLARFWELESFQRIIAKSKIAKIQELGQSTMRETLLEMERTRIKIRTEAQPLSGSELIQKIIGVSGPRIVVLNTVHSAALLAKRLAATGHPVLHLSTALAPCHRSIIINRIKAMLVHQADWTLVATSVVEAGMDFSFRNGFRERASTTSLIQLGGRVNRNAEWTDSILWDFRLSDEDFPKNPGLDSSIYALGELFSRGAFKADSPWSLEALCKEALNIEFSQKGRDEAAGICEDESAERYSTLARNFQIIEADTRTVVINPVLVSQLENFDEVSRIDLVRNSIQLWHSKITKLALPGIKGRVRKDELFQLPRGHAYDPDFLGYMAGVLDQMDYSIPSGFCV